MDFTSITQIYKIGSNNTITIIIGNERILADKEVLIEKSDYFKALLRNETKEPNSNEIIINELQLNAFKLVLIIAHDTHKSEQLLDTFKSNEQLFKVIMISNKYQFFEIEKLSSDKFRNNFERITDLNSFSQIWVIYKKSLSLNLKFMSEICLKYFDENANKVLNYLSLQFLNLTISAPLLISVLSRDTFGVKEIGIFKTVEKWTKIHGFDRSVIKTIRLSQIDEIDINFGLSSSPLFTKNYIRNTLKETDFGNSVEKSRICFQPNVIFNINECVIDTIKVSENLFSINRVTADRITFSLSIETKINHIKFKLNFNHKKLCYPLVYYFCEVCVNSQWIQVIDCTKSPCFSIQELYFDELTVSAIRIIGVKSGIDSEFDKFSIHFLSDNLLHYGFVENPLKNNSYIIPTEEYNYLWVSDSICLTHFMKIGKTYDMTNYVLKNKHYMNSNINFNNYEKFGFETVYLIRLAQPVFANCLQIEFQIDSKQTVNYLVTISQSFQAFNYDNNWTKIVEEVECKTVNKRIVFDAQQILSVRISGFRYFVERVKSPLHIRNVKLYYNNQIMPLTCLNDDSN